MGRKGGRSGENRANGSGGNKEEDEEEGSYLVSRSVLGKSALLLMGEI